MTAEHLETQGIKGGTNCTLSYSSTSGHQSTAVRVRRLAHRFDVVATESHARGYRAMYPHQRALGEFALTLELKGHTEFEKFMQFMGNYVFTLRNSWSAGNRLDAPLMTVIMAVRFFSRQAVPIRGMSFGDHIGSNVFMPTIVFQAASDPLDPEIVAPAVASKGSLPKGSTPKKPHIGVPAKKGAQSKSEADVRNFFYPFSPGSEDPNVKAETIYDFSGFDALAPHPADSATAPPPSGTQAPGTK